MKTKTIKLHAQLIFNLKNISGRPLSTQNLVQLTYGVKSGKMQTLQDLIEIYGRLVFQFLHENSLTRKLNCQKIAIVGWGIWGILGQK